jgi:hypothetical protein
MLYSMDLTVLDLALPSLGRALEPSSAELLVLCAFSTSARMLIIARGLQGIAGATLAPSIVISGSMLLALGSSPAVTLVTDLMVS